VSIWIVGVVSMLLAANSGIEALPEPLPSGAGLSPAPCATRSDPPDNFQTAFAYDLESPAILHFIDVLTAVPSRDQRRLFDAVVNAAPTPAQRQAQVDVAAQLYSDTLHERSSTDQLITAALLSAVRPRTLPRC
jgi:hypothetical protein